MPVPWLPLVGTYHVDDHFGWLFAKDHREREPRYAEPTTSFFVGLSCLRVTPDLREYRLDLGNKLLPVPGPRSFEVLRLVNLITA